MIRGVLAEIPSQDQELPILRHHANRLNHLVESIEADAAHRPAPVPLTPKLEQLPPELAAVPEAPSGRAATVSVRVSRKWETADGIVAFQLSPLDGVLPTFQPGAHIDVHLPNGLVRQYSITNGPGETSYYRIGVKLEPDSRGGSECLHRVVREDDLLAVSEPRNNFPLRRDSIRTILVAGGVGITPMLAMAQALHRMALPFELHYFAQSSSQMAFPEVLERLGESVVRHVGLSVDETMSAIGELVAEPAPATHLYICGPRADAERHPSDRCGGRLVR